MSDDLSSSRGLGIMAAVFIVGVAAIVLVKHYAPHIDAWVVSWDKVFMAIGFAVVAIVAFLATGPRKGDR